MEIIACLLAACNNFQILGTWSILSFFTVRLCRNRNCDIVDLFFGHLRINRQRQDGVLMRIGDGKILW